jgi:hypothetical protein
VLHVPAEIRKAFWLTIPVMAIIKGLMCLLTGEWKLSLRDADVSGMHRILFGATASALAIYVIGLAMPADSLMLIPRSVIAIDWLLTIATACFLRIIFCEKPAQSSEKSKALSFTALLLGIFLLCMGLVFCSLGHDPHLAEWFNGDALYPGHFVQDVFVDGNPMSGWLFPPAPFVFPDFFCAMFGRLLTNQAALGMFFAGAMLFGLVVLSAMYAAAITSRNPKATIVLMAIAAAVMAMGIAWGGSGTRLRFLFMPAYHTGTYALAIPRWTGSAAASGSGCWPVRSIPGRRSGGWCWREAWERGRPT